MKSITKSRSFVILLSLMIMTISSCVNEDSMQIASGNLLIEFDRNMHVRVSNKTPGATELMDGFSASEYIEGNRFLVKDYRISEINETESEGIRKYTIKGIAEKDGISIEKTVDLEIDEEFPDLAMINVKYVNRGEKSVRIEKWVNNRYDIVSNDNEPDFWSFQASSSNRRLDWIVPVNPGLAYYGDHVELSDNGDDFGTQFGIGSVLGTKFTWPEYPEKPNRNLLTSEKEAVWKKWFSLYNLKMLSREPYLGKLYDIGYDKPETHVIRKGENLYYAFYADHWDGPLEFRGLDKSLYRVWDYVNEIDLGTVSSDNSVLETSFTRNLLVELLPVE